MGALGATSMALVLQGASPIVVQLAMAAAGMACGGLWIALSGGLQQRAFIAQALTFFAGAPKA